MIAIDNIDDPRIVYYRDLKSIARVYAADGLFCAEGEKVVKELLQSSLEIVSFFALSEYYVKYSIYQKI